MRLSLARAKASGTTSAASGTTPSAVKSPAAAISAAIVVAATITSFAASAIVDATVNVINPAAFDIVDADRYFSSRRINYSTSLPLALVFVVLLLLPPRQVHYVVTGVLDAISIVSLLSLTIAAFAHAAS
jgi:hypothetical protein